MDLGGAFSAVSQIPIDWLIAGVFFIVVAADALRAGCARACALAISFPLSSLLFQLIPQTALVGAVAGQFQNSIEQALLFIILEVVLFVCVYQMLFAYDRYGSLVSTAVAGLAATIVVLVVWTQTPVLQSLWHFDSQMQNIFGASYRFLWLVGAYLALAFVGS